MDLIAWLDAHFTEHITLDRLSQLFGLTPKYLCRLFKDYTTKTVMEYVMEQRVETACYQLCVQKKSVTEAAFDSGFNDLSYFCKMFKRYKQMTPKEYQRRYTTSRALALPPT